MAADAYVGLKEDGRGVRRWGVRGERGGGATWSSIARTSSASDFGSYTYFPAPLGEGTPA